MYKQILVAVDGSETSARALAAAIKMARDSDARLQPLFVVDVPLMSYDVPGYDPSYVRDALADEGRQVLADAAALMAVAGVKGAPRMLETELLEGEDVAHGIQRAAQELDADLVVMGTHGRRGVRRLVLGSVAEHFLHIAACPVLLVSAHCAAPSANPAHAADALVKDPS
ncbi:universal stress protein [Paraburkholderia ginsengisoli]|uniref:Universal stress protein n=1 Tax=Paraburkholderia ginsengisoli TaxID=311231 RepID=A0A7T4TAI0_9BURK|nr:universal stress protein [Paraburkholderia ginsengisoli]QQC65985.1 universal stress protein [Paraburkholderia ginsengisoli]